MRLIPIKGHRESVFAELTPESSLINLPGGARDAIGH